MILIFIPKARALTARLRETHRLDEVLPASKTITREVIDSPFGSGLLCGWSFLSTDLLRVDKNSQRWSKRFGCDSMIGSWINQESEPATIARANQLPGRSIKLLDGNSWQIPLLRTWHESDPFPRWMNELPCLIAQCPESGQLTVGEVIPGYSQIFNRSLEIADHILGTGDGKILDSDAYQFAIDLLAINYHLDTSVISHLRLLDPPTSTAIIREALDLEAMSTALKKNLTASPDGNSINGHSQVVDLSTDQQSLS